MRAASEAPFLDRWTFFFSDMFRIGGLLGAAVTGTILAVLSRRQPGGPRPQGWRLAATRNADLLAQSA